MPKPVCVIVGAGLGNGAAFAKRFDKAGYRTALLARNSATLEVLENEVPGATGIPVDATDPEQTSQAFAQIRNDVGPPEILIYNASSREFAGIAETTPEAFEHAWRVNAYGCLLSVKAILPDLKKSNHGNIVIIGATASIKGSAGFVAFGSAKAAQRSLAQSLARELGPQGIHVSYVVIDAVVDMPASRKMLPGKPDDFFAKPEAIAESVFFLTRQERSAWTFELDLRPFGESW